jgi:kynureninase
LSELTKDLLAQECAAFGIELVSPGDYERQGGHIAFRAPGAGSVTEALLADGVVSSFRRPEQIRFGLGPLYLSHHDMWKAISRLRNIMEHERWRAPEFQNVSV